MDTGDWFAMEFTSPDKSKGWATFVRMSKTAPASYLFKPRGLDPTRTYSVTFDNTGKTEVIDGATLAHKGLVILPPANPLSELLLFEAK